MSDELNLEDELQKLLDETGETAFDSPTEAVVNVVPPPPDRSKEKVLSQAEIDALLASLT